MKVLKIYVLQQGQEWWVYVYYAYIRMCVGVACVYQCCAKYIICDTLSMTPTLSEHRIHILPLFVRSYLV